MKLAKRATRVAVVILVVVTALAMAAPAVMAQSECPAAPATATLIESPAVRVSAPSPLLTAAGSPVMLSDGFEGTLSLWQVLGSPTWGTTTYRAAAGQASAYCAQSAIPAPGPYADNMSAWLTSRPLRPLEGHGGRLHLQDVPAERRGD